MATRSANVLLNLEDLKISVCDPVDFNKGTMLPSKRFVLERFLTLRQVEQKAGGKFKGLRKSVINDLAHELQEAWIFMNIYPISIKHVRIKLEKFITDFEKLRDYDVQKRNETWRKRFDEFKLKIDNGFDIRTREVSVQKHLEKSYDVRMTESDEQFYLDNCQELEADFCLQDGSKRLKGQCKRLGRSVNVDALWWKSATKRRERKIKELAAMKVSENKHHLEKNKRKLINVDEALASVGEAPADENPDKDDSSPSVEFSKLSSSRIRPTPAATRSNPNPAQQEENESFHQIKTRSSYKSMNVELMEVLVELVAIFKVPESKVCAAVQLVLNKLSGQNLLLPSVDVERMEESEIDLESESKEVTKDSKRSKYFHLDWDKLDCTLPSRLTVSKWVQAAAKLGLWHLVDEIQEAHFDDSTTTLGVDDTRKGHGHRVHDVKTGHVTIINQEHDRSTFTTGYMPNISHSGEDAAVSVTATLDILSCLGGCTTAEVKSYLHLFHSDQAGDADVMLDCLEVDETRRLKCNAHPILCIENAIDKTFASHERSVGKDKLISVAASHVFSSPSNSIFTLGLIALSKLLSPSHSQQTISLYMQYKSFLKDLSTSESDLKDLATQTLKAQFKGFGGGNRFGRVSYLAQTFVNHHPILVKFFENVVNVNQNKLFCACNAYIQSEWFLLCCRISSVFNSALVLPMLQALGIDQGKAEKSEFRSWKGIRSFFMGKLDMLGKMAVPVPSSGAEQIITAVCAGSIMTALKKQLDYMKCFTDEADSILAEIQSKMERAPLTNSGCESEFAFLDNVCKTTSGNTTLNTLSNRHIISRNKLFSHEKWKNLETEQKNQKWKWAMSSREVKRANRILHNFITKVKSAEKASIVEKQNLKKQAQKIEQESGTLMQVLG